ncbi:MAG: hypothetical protein AB7F59_14420 [Bdellovibrionales bacterium]
MGIFLVILNLVIFAQVSHAQDADAFEQRVCRLRKANTLFSLGSTPPYVGQILKETNGEVYAQSMNDIYRGIHSTVSFYENTPALNSTYFEMKKKLINKKTIDYVGDLRTWTKFRKTSENSWEISMSLHGYPVMMEGEALDKRFRIPFLKVLVEGSYCKTLIREITGDESLDIFSEITVADGTLCPEQLIIGTQKPSGATGSSKGCKPEFNGKLMFLEAHLIRLLGLIR